MAQMTMVVTHVAPAIFYVVGPDDMARVEMNDCEDDLRQRSARKPKSSWPRRKECGWVLEVQVRFYCEVRLMDGC